MARAPRVQLLLVVALVVSGCGASRGPVPAAETAPARPTGGAVSAPEPLALERRAFAPQRDGMAVLQGISYGPYREGQRPGGPNPTREQLAEDLRILAPRWGMIRVYSSRAPTETMLEVIRDENLPLQVMVGAWIAPESEEGAAAANAAEVEEAIRLARAFPDQVLAVSVGNETQVSWSAHRSSRAALLGHLETVRAAVSQPVTTADDYNFWNKPESQAVADRVDFLLLHAYAMWNQQPLDHAVAWTAATVASIQAHHPDLPVVIGETGWATELNPEGDEVQHIKAPAGEAEQARFYREFTAWAEAAGQPHFYFEAFDEPWKGSADPREVEKHWGLYTVDRAPKAALSGAPP